VSSPEAITVVTAGAPAAKVVLDAPKPDVAPAVDATGANSALKPPEPAKIDGGDVPPGQDAKDPNLGRAFAALARKDQALRNREDQVKKESAEVKDVRDAITTLRTSKDPAALVRLLELGNVEPGELTDLLISLGKTPSEADRLAALEAARVNDAKVAEEAAIKAETETLARTVVAFKAKIGADAKALGDKFELTLAHGDEGIDLAYECVNAHYENTGKVMPIEEALAKAESHYDAEAKKFLGTKKYGQNRPATSSESTGARADSAPDTLTNNHVSGGPPAVKRVNLTRDESLAEAARLMESRGWGKR
jgi:hypothetical protein